MAVGKELLEVGVQVELLDRGLEGGQQSNGETDTPGGLEEVDAAAHAVNGLGKVKRAPFQEARPLFFADKRAGALNEQLRRQRLATCAQGAANAQRQRQSCFQVQVAGPIALGQADQSFQIHVQS